MAVSRSLDCTFAAASEHPSETKSLPGAFRQDLAITSYNVVKFEEHTLAIASYYYSNSNASTAIYVNKLRRTFIQKRCNRSREAYIH